MIPGSRVTHPMSAWVGTVERIQGFKALVRFDNGWSSWFNIVELSYK